ncbi:SEC-C metal-binding domain-containing protein [Endothiovibrio diazotrophicus]
MEFDPTERATFDDAMTRFLKAAVGRILTQQDPERFLAWMRQEALHTYPELFGGAPDLFAGAEEPPQLRAAALAMGRALWNATPLPGNGYRPRPLPPIPPANPCPCGSGESYQRCCRQADAQLAVPPEVIWPLLMELLPAEEAERVVGEGVVPLDTVGLLAERLMEAGAWKRVVRLLEPRFLGEVERYDERDEHLFEMLMDAYLELGASRKRSALVKRLLEVSRPPFRSVVWERHALMLSDAGDRDGAWEAFHHAQRDNPEGVGIGALEVTLLMADGDLDRLRERSRYWIVRFRRMGLPADHPTMQLFERLIKDPAATLAAMGGDEAGSVARLMALLEEAGTVPPPLYRPQAMDPDDPRRPHLLTPPAAVQKLELDWHEVWPLGKPFSVNPGPFDEVDVWLPEVAEHWLGFLERQPQALGSLTILDDLAMGITQLEHAYTQPVLKTLWTPLLRRAEAVIDLALAERRGITLPWLAEENRPVLRLLGHLASLHDLRHDREAERALLERLLELNPNDNHGHRVRLIDQRLAEGDDEAALAIAERYPEDPQVDISYGRALALFRLGWREEAGRALEAAVEASPLVAEYLLAKRVRKPRIDHFGVTLGGPDEAWLYRDAMRKVWTGTTGALAWLKEIFG